MHVLRFLVCVTLARGGLFNLTVQMYTAICLLHLHSVIMPSFMKFSKIEIKIMKDGKAIHGRCKHVTKMCQCNML